MNKMKIVTTGRGRKRGRGRKPAADRGRGHSAVTARRSQSTTPAPRVGAASPGLKLAINFSGDDKATAASGDRERAKSYVSAIEDEEGKVDEGTVRDDTTGPAANFGGIDVSDGEEPVPNHGLVNVLVDDDPCSRGRAVRKGQHEDYNYGGTEGLQAVGQECHQDREEGSQESVHELQILHLAGRETRKRVRTPSPVLEGIHELKVDDKIYDIMNFLKQSPKIVIDLPDLADREKDTPYSATILMHMYLVAYQSKLWNICDLIADTWIRAFHAQRHRDARSNPGDGLWRRNKVLEKRKAMFRDARKHRHNRDDEPAEFEQDVPEYNLDTQDPDIGSDVVSFDASLLNELYQFTSAGCGARLLWADAMVLAGDKMQRMFHDTVRRGFEWNEQLQFTVMSVSLRMLRRKLTLKIEESTEGAWCARYHEHGRHEPKQPCYRALAAMQIDNKVDGGDEQSSDSSDEDEMEVMMRAVLADEEHRPAKKTRVE